MNTEKTATLTLALNFPGREPIVFSFECSDEGMQNLLNDSTLAMWGEGHSDHGTEEEPIKYADLDERGRAAIVWEYFLRVLKSHAGAHYTREAEKAAKEKAQQEKGGRYK